MDKNEKLLNEYLIWKQNNFNKKKGFFPIFKEFLNYMPNISPGAISLFLYFGLNSKTHTGDSFHSIQTIADFFGKTPRTITNWIKELEDNDLIIRKQFGLNQVSITYLRPYR